MLERTANGHNRGAFRPAGASAMTDNPLPQRRVYRLSHWAIWIAGAAALSYLIVMHRPHLLGWLPYLIILACPLMHFFMHRGHRHHGSSEDHSEESRNAS
jgi:hypothetical protein